MTNDELKAELDALLIEYPAKATKAELEALYAPYAPRQDGRAAGRRARVPPRTAETPRRPPNQIRTSPSPSARSAHQRAALCACAYPPPARGSTCATRRAAGSSARWATARNSKPPGIPSGAGSRCASPLT